MANLMISPETHSCFDTASKTMFEDTVLNTHPDELGLTAYLYLRDPLNKQFLTKYELAWAEVIDQRRQRRKDTPC